MAITKKGIYDIPADEYHAGPCAEPSLSVSGAKKILTTCPAKFKFEQENRIQKRCFDLGRAGHLMVLEPEKIDSELVIVRGFTKDGKPSSGYSSADAKAQREAAYSAGKTPVLPEEYDALKAMRDALWNDPVMSKAFQNGATEKSLIWQCAETGVWCRMRPDFLPNHSAFMTDYKTTTDASPAKFERHMYDMGYHQQAAWYSEGYEAIFGVKPDNFWFVAQEKTAPFLTGAYRVTAEGLEIGHMLNIRARRIFKWCSDAGHWPGYLPDLEGKRVFFDANPPVWLSREHEHRLEVDWYNTIEGIDA